MIRRYALAMVCLAASALPVLADGPVERILDDLYRLGYGRVTVERTLLGRTRIVASNEGTEREIIMDPSTGEILRDLWIPNGKGSSGGGLVGGGNSGTGSSSSDDDDDDDDDDDGDNSGPGGGDDGGDNSGPGGGDDGDDSDDSDDDDD